MTNQATGETCLTLLLVDDEANVRTALTRLLRRDRYRILDGASASEGLDLLAQHPVQVVLSDQRMPEVTGTEFLGRVKVLYPQTIRLLLSGYADQTLVDEAVKQGVVHRFFAKPWDPEALRRDIREAFCQHAMVQGLTGTQR